jgi:hypothetical protein
MTSVRVVHSETCPDIGPICGVRDEPPQLHDQRFNIAEVRLTLAYGVWRWLGVELQAPLRLNHTTVAYRRLDGEEFMPDYPLIHHRNETLFGPGDPWLLARAERRLGPLELTAKAGASLPIGSAEPNPFELGEIGLVHQHVQFGSGTVAPIAYLSAALPIGDTWRILGHGQAQLFLAENEHGYRPGHRFSAGGGASRGFGKLGFSAEAHLAIERPERWNDEILQDGNLGRTDLLLGAAVSYRLGRYALGLGVKVPIYQDVVTTGDEGGQLSYPAIIDLSIEGTFDLGR